jgi:hypothetical protein
MRFVCSRRWHVRFAAEPENRHQALFGTSRAVSTYRKSGNNLTDNIQNLNYFFTSLYNFSSIYLRKKSDFNISIGTRMRVLILQRTRDWSENPGWKHQRWYSAFCVTLPCHRKKLKYENTVDELNSKNFIHIGNL